MKKGKKNHIPIALHARAKFFKIIYYCCIVYLFIINFLKLFQAHLFHAKMNRNLNAYGAVGLPPPLLRQPTEATFIVCYWFC